MRKFLLDALAVIFALGLIEFPALVKAVNYRTVIGPEVSDGVSRTDPELLYIHSAYWHSSGYARGGNVAEHNALPDADLSTYHWDVSYDRNGFRNEADLTSAGIAVIGDSFVETLLATTPELMTSVLQRLEGTAVANLGQFGYGPLHELVVLRRYALPLKPKTVVWMFYEGNDLGDVIHYHKVRMAQDQPPDPAPASSFLRATWDRSFTSNAFHKIRNLKLPPKPSGVRIEGIVQLPGGKTDDQYFGYASHVLSGEELAALDESVRTFAAGSELCRSQGVRLLVVFIPDKFRVFKPFCRFPEQSRCRDWVLSDLPGRLQKSLEAITPRIDYLDLTPIFMDAVSKGIVPYPNDDSHWNPDGARIGAEAVHKYLSSNPPR